MFIGSSKKKVSPVEVMSLRDVVLRTLTGNTCFVKARVPTKIPPQCLPDAIRMGCVPTSELEQGTVQDTLIAAAKRRRPGEMDNSPLGDIDRQKAIAEAFEQVVQTNDPNDFTAAGIPKVQVISQMVGFHVDSSEIKNIWRRIGEEDFQRTVMERDPDATVVDEV